MTVPTSAELMARATERTGLSDFGSPTFLDGLEAMLKSIREEPHHFTPEGAKWATDQFVDRLAWRLMVEDWYARHPEIEAQQPERPVLITGLPRTGTTAFVNIMSLEPSFRRLRGWEQMPPVPPPTPGAEEQDPRRVATVRRFEQIAKTEPEKLAMHLHEVDAANEDVMLMWLEFKAQSFTLPAFGYHDWWRASDMSAAYAYQRRVIKLLQSGGGSRRWLIKSPHYSFHLDALCAVYPDAKIIVTHRDPVKTLASYGSFVSSMWPPGSREMTPKAEMGAHLIKHFSDNMRRMIAARERLGEARFIDVHQREFIQDPVGVVRNVYDFIETPLLPETEAQMRDWGVRNKPGAQGKHLYNAADWGLDEAVIRERFAFYTDKYSIHLEKT